MASISSAGIGSGLNVEDMISKLMSVEQKPVTQLKEQATTIQTKISAYGQIQSALSTFRDAAAALTKSETWSAATATSADPQSVAVTATTGAVTGNYAIQVDKLATPQSVSTKVYPSADSPVGAGDLRIELGSFGQSFVPQPNLAATNIRINAGDSLATVRDKVNAAGAGVSAVIINDATGARLIISSSATGADNAFRIQATDADGNNADADGLSALAYDPDNGANATTRRQTASNAEATVNGVPVSAASNNWTDVIPGLTVNLVKPTTTAVPVGVAQDNASIKTNVTAFVDAYNALNKLLASNVKYDAATGTAGKLQGDSTAVQLQREIRNAMTGESPASATFGTLRSIGIETQADGTLKINDSKLTAALGKPAEVKKLFATSNIAAPEQEGVAMRLRRLGDSLLGDKGSVTNRTTGLNDSLKLNQKRQTEITSRLELTEKRLRAQYSALDTSMAGLTALNTYITNQVAAWNKSS